MGGRAKDGPPLDELVGIATKYCRQAGDRCPRKGPGAPPKIPSWVLCVMVFVGVLLHKKTKNAQYVWWASRIDEFQRWFPGQPFPSRSTYYDRYRRIGPLLQCALDCQGRDAVRKGWAQARTVAIDKSLIAGRGRPWSSADRRQNRVPKRVDTDTTWGYSKHDGWVQGYAFETVVTAAGNGVNWPLSASVETASTSEQKTCLSKLVSLPLQTRHVLGDSGYDSNQVGETVEWTPEGRRTGRRFLCPQVPRPNDDKPRSCSSRQSRARQHHRRLRDQRRMYFRSRLGRRLYARRKTTIEPFNSHLKRLFDLEDRTWHWTLANNRTMVLAAIFAYQTLLTYNHRHGRPTMCIKAILDRL